MALRKAVQQQEEAQVADVVDAAVEATGNLFEDPIQEAPAEAVSTAKEATTKALTKAMNTAVGAASKIKAAYSDFHNVISLEDVEGMGVGAFPRVTVDLGGFMLDKEEIGSEIRLDLLSWNFRYMVTTGANDEEAKKKVKVSYDGETVAGTGESVKDAVETFKEEGYEDASCKCYVDLWGSLITKGGVELEEADRPLVQIQLSPESVKKFKAFQVEVGFKQARGLISDTPTITIKAQRGEWKGNRFGYCTFSLK